jgi:hypothetical protein
MAVAVTLTPDPVRLLGYSVFLRLFLLPHATAGLPMAPAPYEAIALVQHLMALGLIVAGYAFLRRWGVARWVAALAMVPVALDGRELALEHHVVSETLFLVLLSTALIVLARPGRRIIAGSIAGGLLVGAAATVRAVGLPVIAAVVAYLALRRMGWRSLAGFAVASGLVLFGYLANYHHHTGVYAFNENQGRMLAARVSSFADCDHLTVTPRQRAICPTDPAWVHLQRPDAYGGPDAPMTRVYPSKKDDAALGEFATSVIRQQFGDYVRTVAVQSAWHFLPWPPVDDLGQCVIRSWKLPATPNLRCQARMYTDGGPVPDYQLAPVAATPSTRALARYSDVMITPGPLLAIGALVAFGSIFVRRRDTAGRGLTAALFAGVGLILVVTSVATAMYEMRYLMPGLFLIPVGAALGVEQIRRRRRSSGEATQHIEGRLQG